MATRPSVSADAQSNSGDTNTTSWQVGALPVHAPGDLIVVYVGQRASADMSLHTLSTSTPGWVALHPSVVGESTANSRDVIVRPFGKIATSSNETAPLVQNDNTQLGLWSAVVWTIQDPCDDETDIVETSDATVSPSNSPTLPAIASGIGADSLALRACLASNDRHNPGHVTPAGHTLQSADDYGSSMSGGQCSINADGPDLPSIVWTDLFSGMSTSDASASMTIIVPPGTGAPPGGLSIPVAMRHYTKHLG